MIGPHAGTLAFVAPRFLALPHADFLLAIGPDDIDPTVSQQCAIDEVVEPRFRKLPIGVASAKATAANVKVLTARPRKLNEKQLLVSSIVR